MSSLTPLLDQSWDIIYRRLALSSPYTLLCQIATLQQINTLHIQLHQQDFFGHAQIIALPMPLASALLKVQFPSHSIIFHFYHHSTTYR